MEISGLPPPLAEFASSSVAQGRYRDMQQLVETALTRLQEKDIQLAALLSSIQAAEAEADRDGCISAEAIDAEMRTIITQRANQIN